MDIGIRILYLLYGRASAIQQWQNVRHELSKASYLFYFLKAKGYSISYVLRNMSDLK